MILFFLLKRTNYGLTSLYKYNKEDFPLNIRFSEDTITKPNFELLYDKTQEAVKMFNESFNYKFFVVDSDQVAFPKIVVVSMVSGAHGGCFGGFDGQGGVLAHATYPPLRKMCIDYDDMQHANLEGIIMHEMGHLIGLKHTSTRKKRKSLMNPYVDEKVTTFTKYDVERVKQMYTFVI